MPPTSSKPPRLPLAPDRAAISNKISLLLSNRTSLLKTLNPPSSPSSSQQTTTRRHKVDADDIEQLFSGPRPNEGVGYVPDRKAAAGDAAAREDGMLRGRLLGKGKGAAAGKKKFAVESESDEEPGRSGLGKRKRKRRGVEEAEQVGQELGENEVEDAEAGRVEDAAPVLQQQEEAVTDTNGGDDAKRNKKKKKRQREKEKLKLKKLGNPSS
ncbi:hypothetical protein V8C34DRAFT_163092 [Trichoderma compactum]